MSAATSARLDGPDDLRPDGVVVRERGRPSIVNGRVVPTRVMQIAILSSDYDAIETLRKAVKRRKDINVTPSDIIRASLAAYLSRYRGWLEQAAAD